MKIALIRKNYTPYGGAEKYLSRLIGELCRQGHEVHILAQKWEKPPNLGSQFYFHQIKGFSVLSFLESLTFARAACRFLQQEDFDVIHSFERTFFQDLYRAGDGCHREWLKQRKKIAPWLKRFTYSFNPNHLVILYLEKRLLNSPYLKYVIANSQRVKKEIIQHYGLAEGKIRVIYNGVDLQQFHPIRVQHNRQIQREKWGIEEDDVVFLFIGSGFERKGLPFLLKALSFLDKKNLKLLVVGKNGLKKYKEYSRKLGVAERVLFVGPQKEVDYFYGISDFFVLPSIYEPFSNACVEALASGLPVITSKINGAAELIKAGENGLLINDPTNIWEIKDRLQEAWKIWGRGGYRERIRDISPLTTIESNVQELISIYKEVLDYKRKKVD
jgi:UDP-glucose:(heptosyl)LPS alpha-1,3-glucosyltransferase